MEPEDLTRPVDRVLDHRACGEHLLGFAGRSGLGHRRPHTGAWGYRADGVNHLAQGLGAAPGDQEEGGVASCHGNGFISRASSQEQG